MIKRIFDLAISIPALILLTPLILFLAIMVRIKMGSPVLFVQVRPGYRSKPIELFKFRTMINKNGHDGKPLPDEQRLVPFGTWMRRFSLDELPQLFNVIKGELSLVGPRPLLMEYLDRYTPEQARRHEVKPGITGWAQINGRNNIEWEEKFAMDVWYVDHSSLWLDVVILWRTIGKVFRSEGISKQGHATMPTFMGSSGEQ
ncbi:sugar transferase [Paenibacillus ginsengarvi]|uniref:Sugar transferase n=1 Tax=Paenibacillus ginsengarvi TaxID=400777 RepID=A0A3B0CLB7_9BACL|nr:sugar transferase [Paenibacillus ginsengarvi]RKN85651.1 sugar transferase [Paenibacillus ginsengarvi]